MLKRSKSNDICNDTKNDSNNNDNSIQQRQQQQQDNLGWRRRKYCFIMIIIERKISLLHFILLYDCERLNACE